MGKSRASGSFSIRRGTPADRAAAKAIFVAALCEHGRVPVEDVVARGFETFGQDPSRDDFVATQRGIVIGFAILRPAIEGRGELNKIFIAPQCRAHGVGTALIEHVVAAAEHRGYRDLVLYSLEEFAVACAYYARHGWTRGPDLPDEVSRRRSFRLDLVARARTAQNRDVPRSAIADSDVYAKVAIPKERAS